MGGIPQYQAKPNDLSYIGVLGEKWETDKRGRRSSFMHNGVEMSISRGLQGGEAKPQTDTTNQNCPGTLLWEVSKPGVAYKSYLFGTFHEVDADFFATLPVAVARLNDATLLYVEETLALRRDTTHTPETGPWNQEQWETIMNQDQRKVFSAFVAKTGIQKCYRTPPAELNIRLENIYFLFICDKETRTNYDIMDSRIENMARAQSKTVFSLDERHDNLLSREAQTLNSLQNAKYIEADISLMQAMLDNDASGCGVINDYKKFALDYQLDQEAGADGITRLVKRNSTWLKTLALAFQREKCFVAVGVRHLFYKEGLISQLRNRGYRVEPISLR